MIKNRYKSFPIAVKASAWYALSNVLIKGTSFFTIPIFSRVMSVSDFGKYNLFLSWNSIFTIFLTLNLSMGVFVKGMTKYEDDREVYTSSMELLTICLFIFWVLVFIFFQKQFTKLTGLPLSILLLMSVQILCISAVNFWFTRLRFDFKYKQYVLISLIIGVGTPVINLIAILLVKNDYTTIIYSFVFFQSFIGLFFVVKNLKKVPKRKLYSHWKYALNFNLPLIPYYLSQILLDQVDRVMIGNSLGDSEVALYNVPYQISMALTIVSASISNSLVPLIHRKLKDKTEENLRAPFQFILIFLFLICQIVILFAPELIGFLAPKSYKKSVFVVAPVLISMLVKFIIDIFTNTEFYFEYRKISLISMIIACLSNIFLNQLLLPKFGFIVAGYTTLFSFILALSIHMIMLKRRDKKTFFDYLFIVKILLISTSFVLLSQLLFNYALLRYTLVTCLVIYIFSIRKKIFEIRGMQL